MNYKSRSEVPDKYKWDLSKRFKNSEEWKLFYAETMNKIRNLNEFKNLVTKSAENLFNTLEEYYDIESKVIKLTSYAILKLDEDLNNQEFIRLNNLGNQISSEFDSYSSFIEPEILSCEDNIIEQYLKDYTPLNKYSYYLNKLLKKKSHILSDNEERIISLLSKGYNSLDTMNNTLLNSEIDYGTIIDETGQNIDLISNNIRKFIKSYDRDVRKNAYYQSYKARMQFQKTIGSNLINYMEYTTQLSKIRNYNNAIEMVFQSSDIPFSVNQTLNKVVNDRIESFRQYYINLKRYLKLSDLEHYDKAAIPFKVDKVYTIEEAKTMIKEGLSILGPKYMSVIDKAFSEQWIDFCSYKGKTNGAYCLSNYGDTPVVLVNFQGKIEDILTIVHELGHAVHGYFRLEQNDKNNYYNDLIVSEITSLTNEIIFSNYILKNEADDQTKKVILYKLLDTIQNNLFMACLEGELENIVYERLGNDEVVIAEDLNDIILNLTRKYFGDSIKENQYMKYLWLPISHYFIPFYLYKYAVSVSIACYIGKEIIEGNNEVKEKYINFLYLGKNGPVVDMIKHIGIDINKEDVYQKAIDYYKQLLEQLDKMIK